MRFVSFERVESKIYKLTDTKNVQIRVKLQYNVKTTVVSRAIFCKTYSHKCIDCTSYSNGPGRIALESNLNYI